MHVFPKNAGIRAKLVTIFILIKVLPLIVLAWLVWQGIQQLESTLSGNISKMAAEMRATVSNVGKHALDKSVLALDKQAQESIERQTIATASAVADFLHSIDRDISFVASIEPNGAAYRDFVNRRRRDVPVHRPWQISADGSAWEPSSESMRVSHEVKARVADNAKEFHYRPPDAAFRSESRPLYLEASFVNLDGIEQIRVTTSDLMPSDLRDVADRTNTWLMAESYFTELQSLRDDEIYVSDVIGAYVKSPIIGPFTPKRAKEGNIRFTPKLAAYAGKENPVGRRFQGLVRWVKPVIKDGARIGYATIALDHTHLMTFTDHFLPTTERFSEISDPGSGNYAFMWDHKGRNISHARDYFIVGYDPKTGKPVPPWLDKETHQRWTGSGLPFDEFIEFEPTFKEQSLKRKPAIRQIADGQVALDCRYLNFAPQCAGWWNLTQYGGSGSFVIFWSGLWKLTTAAVIPYFTGQYGNTPRGFGFVTIGANVHEFHLPATEAKKQIDEVVLMEDQRLSEKQKAIDSFIQSSRERLTYELSTSTLVMILFVVIIGIWMASYLTRRILHLTEGLTLFRAGNLKYRFEIGSEDEMGKLARSFNAMANTIDDAVINLRQQISKRETVERELAESNRNLESIVESRTLELKESNRKLTLENEERKRAEACMTLMAQHDDLTGLANRALFRDHLNVALAQAGRSSEQVALFFIDLDKFKEVNDRLGHDVGDKLLIDVAKLIDDSVREGDTAARLGGDEFAMVLAHVSDSGDLADVAQRLIDRLTGRFNIGNHTVQIGCSIGIALYPDDANDFDDLVKHADVAMYQAKERGGGNYQFFIAEMQKAVESYKNATKDLRNAIDGGELLLHYQPKIDIGSGRLVGAEALVRWNDPRRGMVFPSEFIPIAEKGGLIDQLGECVLREACRQSKIWQESGYRPFRIAVNASTIQLHHPEMVDHLSRALRDFELAPRWLEVELTESTLMLDQDKTADTIRKLQALEVCVSIDDFGTGYSSFGRLKQLSFDAIKIDRSFIHGIGNENDEAIVKAIIAMGHTLNTKLIAEGVEAVDQLEFLRREGCDQAQGYYFSRPIPADEFVYLLSMQSSALEIAG